MSVTLAQTLLIALLLGSARAGAWLAICPPFNGKSMPTPAKALLSIGMTLPLTPHIASAVPAAISTPALLFDVAEQVVIGAALGFCTNLLFSAAQSAGALVDLFGGFSVAFAFDPFAYSGNAVFGRFYNLTAMTLLFTTGADQLMIAGFARSYRAVPLAGTPPLNHLSRLLTDGVGQMFLSAVQMAGPLIGVLFITDLALGLLSRVAPSLNVFSLAFPAKILLTLSIMGAALVLLPGAVRSLVDAMVTAAMSLFGT